MNGSENNMILTMDRPLHIQGAGVQKPVTLTLVNANLHINRSLTLLNLETNSVAKAHDPIERKKYSPWSALTYLRTTSQGR